MRFFPDIDVSDESERRKFMSTFLSHQLVTNDLTNFQVISNVANHVVSVTNIIRKSSPFMNWSHILLKWDEKFGYFQWMAINCRTEAWLLKFNTVKLPEDNFCSRWYLFEMCKLLEGRPFHRPWHSLPALLYNLKSPSYHCRATPGLSSDHCWMDRYAIPWWTYLTQNETVSLFDSVLTFTYQL